MYNIIIICLELIILVIKIVKVVRKCYYLFSILIVLVKNLYILI